MKKLFVFFITLLSIGITQAQVEFKSVKIGSQTWMKENLNVSTFRNGDPVPEAKTAAEWKKAFDEGTPAWCYYNNDPANGKKYGKLYNGYAYNDARGLAPAGWHIPTNDEYTILIEYLGGKNQAGLKLIVPGQYGGTNTSGFSGLLAGMRFIEGDFDLIEGGTFFATSTIEQAGRSFSMAVNFQGDFIRTAGNWAVGISIRCIKDAKTITENTKPPAKPKPVTTTPVANKPVATKPPTSIGTSKAPAKLTSVKIGKQTWMVKNLDVATYRNGDPIPNVTDNTAWSKLTTGAYCYYNNDSATYAATYGKLYNWYAVNDPRGLAPAGWHTPSDAEWTTLVNYLGGEKVAEDKMKEKGTKLWGVPNRATNSSGFSGLPGGNRDANSGTFGFIGGKFFTECIWWSSTESAPASTGWSWCRKLIYFSSRFERKNQNGYSVRCLRD